MFPHWLLAVLLLQAVGNSVTSANELQIRNEEPEDDVPLFTIASISSHNMDVTWQRSGLWTDETRYVLSIRNAATPGTDWCRSISYICYTVECTVNTKNVCPLPMDPCTSYAIMLTGGEVPSDWQYTQTAPEDYGGLKLVVGGQTLGISWQWPETPSQEETCLSEFIVTVTSVGKEEVIVVPRTLSSDSDMSNTNVTLMYYYKMGICDTGGGIVRVQAAGGNGQSEGQVAGFTFDGEGLPPVLYLDPFEVGSTTIKTSWHLTEDCPFIDTFAFYALDEVHETITGPYYSSLYTYTFTNILPNTDYTVCVLPLGYFDETLPAGENVCEKVTTLP